MIRSVSVAALAAAFALVSGAAQAHTGGDATHGLMHGFAHPVGGLDHLLAMVGVGLWAAQQGGRALWLVPASFLVMMAVGGVMGMAGVALPAVELGIAGSVLFIGVLIGLSQKLPVGLGMALVGVLALFHGQAHGAEMPVEASGALYAIGFLAATAVLHGVGIGLALAGRTLLTATALRLGGAGIAGAGAALLLG